MEALRPRRSASHILHPLPWRQSAAGCGGSRQGASAQPGPPAAAVQRRQLRASTFLQRREWKKKTKNAPVLQKSTLFFRNFGDNLCRFIHSWDSNLTICPPPTQKKTPLCFPSRPHGLTQTWFTRKHSRSNNGGRHAAPALPSHTGAGTGPIFFFPPLFLNDSERNTRNEFAEVTCLQLRGPASEFEMFSSSRRRPSLETNQFSLHTWKKRPVHVIFVHLLNTLKKFRMSTKEMKTLI